jgi:pilus assembly protein CpaB
MNLSKGTLFMVAAGVVGLLAMFTVHHYIAVRTQVAVKPMSHLVIATADMSIGSIVTPTQVKAVSWPSDLVPPKALANLSDVEGRVLNESVSKGEPILMTKLAPKGTSAGLAAMLQEGKRALSVRVDDVSGVAGFVHPGDHVDVLMDLAMPGAKDEHFSKTILQNVVVLSAGQTWEQVRDEKPKVVNTVTLVLTTEEAEVLNLASNQGKIRLTLRNRNDVGPVPTRGVETSSLMGIQKIVNKAPEPKHQENTRSARNVEVIKGLDRSQVNL